MLLFTMEKDCSRDALVVFKRSAACLLGDVRWSGSTMGETVTGRPPRDFTTAPTENLHGLAARSLTLVSGRPLSLCMLVLCRVVTMWSTHEVSMPKTSNDGIECAPAAVWSVKVQPECWLIAIANARCSVCLLASR